MLLESALPGRWRFRLRGTRRWDRIALMVCAVLALTVGLLSRQDTAQHLWGVTAAGGYFFAALIAARSSVAWARGPAVTAVVGSAVLPLVRLTMINKAQMEVGVVERGARLLLSAGSPYQETPHGVRDFNPYLPGMSLFGIPHALFGDRLWTSARWWLVLGFLVVLFSAGRLIKKRGSKTAGHRAPALWVLWLTACPLVALPLAIGGVDPTVVALLCLGFTFAHLGLAGRAGLVLGAAAALKWTAWPALPVVIAFLAARGGRRHAMNCFVGAAGFSLAAVVPFILIGPQGFLENVVLYPFGLSDTPSTAASPLPGYLIATSFPHGKSITVALLTLAAVTIGISLLWRPPQNVIAATDRLTLGLAIAIILAPASRVGYAIYPILLLAWPRLLLLQSIKPRSPGKKDTDRPLSQRL
ncbi:glycosyltransferase 87 family protein [Streptomyces sp900105245]|uniref:Glycosyltransferase 87 family protein n=1 Tax=Streptomyces sp. 900105245 TaxID=3154379 RepID=A0ABV1ULG5_9ACTN